MFLSTMFLMSIPLDRRMLLSQSAASALSTTASGILTHMREDLHVPIEKYFGEEGEGESKTSEVERVSNRVDFYGEVNSESCYNLIRAVKMIPSPLEIHIQSYGGEVMPMLNVLDVMDGLDSLPSTYIDGYACSAATLLSVYGGRRYMSKRSFVLLHELRASFQGTYSQVTSQADYTKSVMRAMTDVYLEKTHLSRQQLQGLYQTERWLGAEECLRFGIVDEIVT